MGHMAVFGWFFILFFGGVVYILRTNTREVLKISGSQIDDILAGMFLWPTVLAQINEALDDGPVPSDFKPTATVETLKAQMAKLENTVIELKGQVAAVELMDKTEFEIK